MSEDGHARPWELLPGTPLAWLVLVAAVVAAFAAGHVAGAARATLRDIGAPVGTTASETPPSLFSDLQPPDLQRALRSEGTKP